MAFRVVADNYVTDDSGTGIVHCAPAFGEDDYRVCIENQIINKVFTQMLQTRDLTVCDYVLLNELVCYVFYFFYCENNLEAGVATFWCSSYLLRNIQCWLCCASLLHCGYAMYI